MTLKYSESIGDLILATLGSARNSRLFRQILSEKRLQKFKKESVRVTLTRLCKKGYIQNSDIGWFLTKEGEESMQKEKLLSYINSPFKKEAVHNMIVSFDIPEHSRIYRDWLRNQIKIFGYKMLQQSLWVGPGPLPLSFMKRLEILNIRKNIKTFKINNKK